ncbi:phosphodiester glycosidase family protein [Microbacterium sp. ARD31]|uniref:phosphodiester glycosidase family protein n=1 Tax=Microbacterium sp. ARD31 TaxID=2962576 RepID=UPI002882C699|nr:phosphodiester glycosidase family protein [Microbacterium sp. ARD31]MDT0185358.1 phosphodiester glycosidase family protein [Microbacterium sp. ARD31]
MPDNACRSSSAKLTRSRLLTVATAGVLVAGLGVGPSVADDGDSRGPGAAGKASAGQATGGYRGRNQTSDGKPGIVVGPEVDLRGKAQVKNDVSYEIAPGVVLREWDQVDGRQPVGQVRMNLVTVSLDAPNISFEELSPTYVTSRKKVSQLGGWNGALTAVNGDFFDIGDTDAPLGVTVNRTRGLLGGSREGWIPGVNSTLWFDGSGPHVSPLSVQYTIRQRKAWTVSGINHPVIPPGQIGVFTSDWHRTEGYKVTSGKKRAREVILRKNRVISNRPKLSDGKKIGKKDRVLIGTGSAAGKLATLRKGKKITLAQRIEGGNPTVAISGDRPLLVNGLRSVVNNTIAHPRTAVGIDADGRKLLILVVDGRSSVSRGYTMVELADMMTALGAENAINLDGGGSSAMYTRNGAGVMGIVNEPSDGSERLVPNGFGVVYTGTLPPVVPILPTPAPTPTVAPTPTPTVPPTTPPAP